MKISDFADGLALRKAMMKRLCLLLGAAIVVQSLGCGTILYPERRGQRGGRVDAGVAILDGIGLLFFIIPGVIAFAVDFGNGTIYLPSGGRGMSKFRIDPKGDERAAVEAVVRLETGYPLNLDQENLESVALKSVDELPERFARAPRRDFAPEVEP